VEFQKQTDDHASFCLQNAYLGAAKESAIAQARVHVMKIQAILNEVNVFTSQLLVRASLLHSDHTAVNELVLFHGTWT
jgi:hypothetical protein